MAKKQTKTVDVATLDPMVKAMVDQIRLAFHDKHKRVLNLDDTEIHALFEGDEFNDDDAFTKLIATEQAKLRKAMITETTGDTGGISRQELVDVANRDVELQSITSKYTEAKDFPAKAPAQMAYRLFRDYTVAQRNAFAVPMSDQKTHKDAQGNDIGENMRKGYRWDKYHAKAVTGETIEGSWYQDFADDTTTGKYLVTSRNALSPNEMHENKDNVPITIDGITMDVLKMDKDQRKSFHSIMTQRRSSLAVAYRKAMQVINKIDEINQRLGNTMGKDGKINRYGTVHAGFVLLDAMNPDKGVSPSKSPIRLTALYQDDVKDVTTGNVLYPRGMLSNNVRDLLVSEIINLDIDKAFIAAGKASRELPNINEVVSSKYVRKETTQAGEKKPEDSSDQTLRFNAKQMVKVFEGSRLFTENTGSKVAFNETLVNLSQDALKMAAYDIGETLLWLSDLYTNEMAKLHDKVKDEAAETRQKELNEKLGKTA